MGQLYSFLGYSSATENNNQDSVLASNFSCKICLEILHDPVQCRNNEHYFCRKCITKHLENSETCPLCVEKLTLETLRAVPRIVLDVISQMKKPSNDQHVCTKKYGQIFIFGGGNDATTGKTVEVFNWSTNTWTLIENCLFLSRYNSFSFFHGKKIMVCGGNYTVRIEYLNPSESGYYASVASVSLPSHAQYNGVLYDNRILTFHEGVVETSLQSPGESKALKEEEQVRYRSSGVHCFGGNIYIVGGQPCSMEKYDVAKNELQTLATIPYAVSDMATVAYKDNIIFIGGKEENSFPYQPLNDVVMFNITSQEYKKLPSMLTKRCGCTAVIMGDVIVAMGGVTNVKADKTELTMLNTVEYYVIGDSAWKELPPMNLAREGATACVYV